MAISKLGAISSDNWELISSVTPTVSTTAVNFTSLSTYKKLMVLIDSVVLNSTGGELALRINNDSGDDYVYSYYADSTNRTSIFTSSIIFTGTAGTGKEGAVLIENCDNAGLKLIPFAYGSDGSSSTGARIVVENGVYRADAIVSQINIITTGGFTYTAVGTIALYGVK